MPWKFGPWPAGRGDPRPSPQKEGDRSPRGEPVSRTTAFIARQPLFDALERVVGYELLIRPCAGSAARPPATTSEEVNLVLDAVTRFGVEQALGERQGLLRLSPSALAAELPELLPKERFLLEYAAPEGLPAAAAARLADLRARGWRLARRCSPGEGDALPPDQPADLVVFDLKSHSLQEIVRLGRPLTSRNIRRLVRNVMSRADFESCRGVGFDLYQGNLFAHPETLAVGRLDPSRLRVLELFNLVIGRADVSDIEAAFKHDVALCYSLLCYINSAGIGLAYKVSSIRDAIMLLGYDFLARWLALLLYAGVDLTAAQRLLLNTALIRGRLAELLGQPKLGSREASQLFLTGMFSLLDAALGLPLAEVAARLHLPQEMTEALCNRTGRYAPWLELALAFEEDDLATAQRLCSALDIDLDQASQAHLSALEWAGVLAR